MVEQKQPNKSGGKIHIYSTTDKSPLVGSLGETSVATASGPVKAGQVRGHPSSLYSKSAHVSASNAATNSPSSSTTQQQQQQRGSAIRLSGLGVASKLKESSQAEMKALN